MLSLRKLAVLRRLLSGLGGLTIRPIGCVETCLRMHVNICAYVCAYVCMCVCMQYIQYASHILYILCRYIGCTIPHTHLHTMPAPELKHVTALTKPLAPKLTKPPAHTHTHTPFSTFCTDIRAPQRLHSRKVRRVADSLTRFESKFLHIWHYKKKGEKKEMCRSEQTSRDRRLT